MDKTIEEFFNRNEELDWDVIQMMIIKTAEQNIGVLRRPRNVWYNSQCQRKQRKKARENHLIFISERKACKKILQQ